MIDTNGCDTAIFGCLFLVALLVIALAIAIWASFVGWPAVLSNWPLAVAAAIGFVAGYWISRQVNP
jgi:uncharacterized integral membrane protein